MTSLVEGDSQRHCPNTPPHASRSIPFLALLVLGGLLLRLIFVTHYSERYGDDSDSRNFHRMALSMAAGKGMVAFDGSPTSERPPLYVMSLAASYRLFGPIPLPVQILQCLLGAAIIWLAYRLALEAGLSRRLALGVAAFLAAYPTEIYYSSQLMSELFFQGWFCLWLLLLLRMLKASGPGLGNAALAGVAAGVASLCRSEPFVLQLALPAIWWLLAARDRQWRRCATQWAVAICAMLLTMSPWAIRNHQVHGKWMFLYHAGYVLADGINPFTHESYGYVSEEVENAWTKKHIEPYLKELTRRDEIDAAYVRASLFYASQHWRELYPTWLYRIWHTWSPMLGDEYGNSLDQRAFKTVFLVAESILLLGMLLSLLLLAHWRQLLLFWLYVPFLTALHILYPAMIRYRFPFLPAMCICAAAGFAALWQWHRARRAA